MLLNAADLFLPEFSTGMYTHTHAKVPKQHFV